ncbi:MAG: hypothetical protein C5B52_18685 [Bacteroidetes bacterium]|nr:MAG: hypothetical protein C5B52_18685 [Bacteroidota bacterium]
MKKLLGSFIAVGFMMSCNNQASTPVVEEKKPADTTVAEVKPTPKIDYPYAAEYSAEWKIGDPNNTRVVLDFYKALEEGKTDELKKFFADSVKFRLYDTRSGNVSADEAVKRIATFRARFKSLNESFLAFIPLHSNDRNEDWVSTWMKEKAVSLNGKADSTIYQENWGLRNGKITSVEGFAQYKFRH